MAVSAPKKKKIIILIIIILARLRDANMADPLADTLRVQLRHVDRTSDENNDTWAETNPPWLKAMEIYALLGPEAVELPSEQDIQAKSDELGEAIEEECE